MFKINNWKEPIYKNDLINVLINGALIGLLSGILAGVVDYLFALINFPLAFGLIIISYLIGYRVRKGYYSYHILYPTLSILFMIIALFISDVTRICMVYGDIRVLPIILTDGSFYLDFILGPFYYIWLCIKSFDMLSLLMGILDIVIYGWAFTFCFRMVKGRN